MTTTEHAVPHDVDDVAYVRRDYLTLEAACAGRDESADDVRRGMATGRMPRPSYFLAGGTEMVPPDYFALADAAGGWAALPAWFAARLARELTARGMDASPARVAEEWTAYLAGEYGVCLRGVTPAGIAEKARLVDAVSALLASPRPAAAGWREALRRDVDRLDAIVRRFTRSDRARFGGSVSRERLIDAAHARYPALWRADQEADAGRP